MKTFARLISTFFPLFLLHSAGALAAAPSPADLTNLISAAQKEGKVKGAVFLVHGHDEAAKEKFPGGWKTLKPYLRVVPQPNKQKKAADQG